MTEFQIISQFNSFLISNALYLMVNKNFGNRLQVSLGARWEDYSMKMAPYPVSYTHLPLPTKRIV